MLRVNQSFRKLHVKPPMERIPIVSFLRPTGRLPCKAKSGGGEFQLRCAGMAPHRLPKRIVRKPKSYARARRLQRVELNKNIKSRYPYGNIPRCACDKTTAHATSQDCDREAVSGIGVRGGLNGPYIEHMSNCSYDHVSADHLISI